MPGRRGDSAFWHGSPWIPWQWKSRCPFKVPVSFSMLELGSHACPRLERVSCKSFESGFGLTFYSLAMHACPREPVSVTGRGRDGTHAGSSPASPQEQDMGWSRSSAVYLPSSPFGWLQMNTWRHLVPPLLCPSPFCMEMGTCVHQLRGQCCPLTFIASLPNSWMGAKSDWSHGSQEELACLSVKILFSISNQAHFSFCIIKYSFFDQNEKHWFILIPQHGMGDFQKCKHCHLSHIKKKKRELSNQ